MGSLTSKIRAVIAQKNAERIAAEAAALAANPDMLQGAQIDFARINPHLTAAQVKEIMSPMGAPLVKMQGSGSLGLGKVGEAIGKATVDAGSVSKAIVLTPTIAAVSLVSKDTAADINKSLNVLGEKELAIANIAAKAAVAVGGGMLIAGVAAGTGAGAVVAQTVQKAEAAKDKIEKAVSEPIKEYVSKVPALKSVEPLAKITSEVENLFKTGSERPNILPRPQAATISEAQAANAPRQLDWLETIFAQLAQLFKG